MNNVVSVDVVMITYNQEKILIDIFNFNDCRAKCGELWG